MAASNSNQKLTGIVFGTIDLGDLHGVVKAEALPPHSLGEHGWTTTLVVKAVKPGRVRDTDEGTPVDVELEYRINLYSDRPLTLDAPAKDELDDHELQGLANELRPEFERFLVHCESLYRRINRGPDGSFYFPQDSVAAGDWAKAWDDVVEALCSSSYGRAVRAGVDLKKDEHVASNELLLAAKLGSSWGHSGIKTEDAKVKLFELRNLAIGTFEDVTGESL